MPLSPGMCWLPIPPAIVKPSPLLPLISSTSMKSLCAPFVCFFLFTVRCTLFPAFFRASTAELCGTSITQTLFTWVMMSFTFSRPSTAAAPPSMILVMYMEASLET